ncbi:MAG: PepSY domain-containing protein [Gammaproteobacteria bacterium]|nr:PepSY domain-containing protein [Gammaproteobacteria bacterium]
MKTIYLFLALVTGTISLQVEAGNELGTDQIRSLVKQGDILSLESILKKHSQFMTGRLLDLEVETEHGQIIYELEFLMPNGDVVELEIDAENGEILEQEIER